MAVPLAVAALVRMPKHSSAYRQGTHLLMRLALRAQSGQRVPILAVMEATRHSPTLRARSHAVAVRAVTDAVSLPLVRPVQLADKVVVGTVSGISASPVCQDS